MTVTINGNPPSALQKQELAQAFGLASSDSPALTGAPTVPTAPAGTNTTQIASTAFVKGEVDAVLEALPSSIPSYAGPTNVTPILTVNHTTGVPEWTTNPALSYLDTTYDLRVAGMTVGLGGGASGTNMAMGTGALETNTTGFGIAAVGAMSLAANTTGSFNAGFGYATLSSVSGGSSYNTALGTLAGSTINGSHNTLVGATAGSSIQTGNSNTIIGKYTGTASMSSTLVLAAGSTVRAWCDNTGKWGFGTNAPTAALDLSGDSIRVRTASTPASASDTGETGTVKWDANYVYVCTAPNTWKAAALTALGSPAPMQATISNGLAVVQIEGFPYALLPVGADGAIVANFSSRSNTLANLMSITGNPSEVAVPTDDYGLVTYNAAGVARHFPRLDSPETTYGVASLAIGPTLPAGVTGVSNPTVSEIGTLSTAIGVNAVTTRPGDVSLGSMYPGVNRRFSTGMITTTDASDNYLGPYQYGYFIYRMSSTEPTTSGVYIVNLDIIVRDDNDVSKYATLSRKLSIVSPGADPVTEEPLGPTVVNNVVATCPDFNVDMSGLVVTPTNVIFGAEVPALILKVNGLAGRSLRWVVHAEFLTMTDEVTTWQGLN